MARHILGKVTDVVELPMGVAETKHQPATLVKFASGTHTFMNKDEFKDDEGNYLVAVRSYFVDSISDRLIRTILTGPQKTIDLDNHPHQGLKGIFLNRPINERKNRKVLWEREQKQAIKDGNLPPWAKDDEPPEGGGSTTKKSEQDILEKIQNAIDILKRELL